MPGGYQLDTLQVSQQIKKNITGGYSFGTCSFSSQRNYYRVGYGFGQVLVNLRQGFKIQNIIGEKCK